MYDLDLKVYIGILWICVCIFFIPYTTSYCRCAYPQEMLIQFYLGIRPFLNLEIWPKWKILLKQFVCATPLKPLSDETSFLSDCPSLMLWIAIRCIQHSQTMLECGVCELAHSFFHFSMGEFNCWYIWYDKSAVYSLWYSYEC